MPTIVSRRAFLQSTAPVIGAMCAGSSAIANGFSSANERPVFGLIGTGIRGKQLMNDALPYGPIAALCDVDSSQLAVAMKQLDSKYARASLSPLAPSLSEDYRRVLDRSDIDAVIVATPDHWHSKVAIEAMHAGKDVYCEKPMTLTIEEGQQIVDAMKATGRVMQVGTQQRSDGRFQTAVAMMRAGRIGKPSRVTCAIGGSPTCNALPKAAPPQGLNWNRWLGPAPYVDYLAAPELPNGGYGNQHPHSRCHAHFRWWYDYAGGKITDWGAHHVDIAMWGLDKSTGSIGAFEIDPIRVEHPVEFVDGYAVAKDRFDVATRFHARITFADGIELDVVDDAKDLGFGNGVMFQSGKGRFMVNRGKLVGKPAEDLKTNPLPNDATASLYPTAKSASGYVSHMKNFLDCVKSRGTPISDVASHHRNLTVCHAINIAFRLGRKLTYDTGSQKFVGDDQANTFLARTPRKGFETQS